jgi:cytochrome c-type biogenesis protein CcmH
MMWALFAVLTAVALGVVVHPLLRRDAGVETSAPRESEFYRRQLVEIERDRASGLLTETDAESARVEAARRLLQAKATPQAPTSGSRPRWAVAGLFLVAAPFLALALYLRLGQPDLPDLPLAARAADPQDIEAIIAKVEKRLREVPDDGRGHDVLAPVYMRLGRMPEAERAFAAAIRLLGENPARLIGLAEAKISIAGGVVTAEARQALERASALDPTHPRALFLLGVAAEQDGAPDRARALFEKILANGPADAPWLPTVRQRLAGLSGTVASSPPMRAGQGAAPQGDAAAAIAALPPEQRQAQIRTMVEGLAARLSQNGQDVQGWLRLIRAWTVLGEKDKARGALAEARKALEADAPSRVQIDGLARELGLEG